MQGLHWLQVDPELGRFTIPGHLTQIGSARLLLVFSIGNLQPALRVLKKRREW